MKAIFAVAICLTFVCIGVAIGHELIAAFIGGSIAGEICS